MEDHKLQTAELLVRIFAGILFLFQGYDKLFKIKISAVVDAFMNEASGRNIPRPTIVVISYATSLIEFFGGAFLILGFLTTYTLYALGIDLILVAVAFSFMNPIWDMKHVFPRLLLVTFLLVIPVSERCFSLDQLFQIK